MNKIKIATLLACSSIIIGGVLPIAANADSNSGVVIENVVSDGEVNCITSQLHELNVGEWEAIPINNKGDYKEDVYYINDTEFSNFTKDSVSGSNKYHYYTINSLYSKGTPVDIKFIAEVGKEKPSTGSTESYHDYTLTTPLFNQEDLDYSKLSEEGKVQKYLIHLKLNLDETADCSICTYYYSHTSSSSYTYRTLRLEPFEMVSGDAADTVDIKEKLKKAITGGEFNNDTTEQDILDKIKNELGDEFDVSFDPENPFDKTDATEEDEGKISGKIVVTDGVTKIEASIGIPIKKLPQTVESAADKIEKALADSSVNNDTTEDDLLDKVGGEITNSDITVSFDSENPFEKVEATEDNAGKIGGNIIVTDGVDKVEVNVDLPIEKLPQTIQGVANKIEKVFADGGVSNATTEDDLLDKLKDTITNSDITVSFDSENPFKKTDATEESQGKVTGTVIVADKDDKVEVNVDFPIEKLPQTVQGAADKIEKVLADGAVNNSTTEDELLDKLKNEITNSNITVSFDSENPFKKTDATEESAGEVTGTVVVTDGTDKLEIPVNLPIEKLPQTAKGAVEKIKKIVTNGEFNNDTTEQDILDKIKNELGDGFDVSFDPENPFKKVAATEDEEGQIIGTVRVQLYPEPGDGSQPERLEISITLPKLDNSKTENKDKDLQSAIDVVNALNKKNYSNATDEKAILDIVKNAINDDSISVAFDEEDPFNKVDATKNAAGSITGTLILTKDDSTDPKSAKVKINLTINRLGSSSHHSSSSSSSSSKSDNKNTDSNNKVNVSLDDIVNNTKGEETEINNSDFKGKITHYSSRSSSGKTYHYIVVQCDETSTNKIDVNVKALDTGIKTIYCNNSFINKLVKEKEAISDDTVSLDVKCGNTYVIADNIAAITGIKNNDWYEDKNKNWFFVEGETLKNGWLNDKGYMYKLADDGVMQTGWINDNGVKKYLNTVSDGFKGAMRTGWTKIDEKWYYFNEDGSMKTGWFKDWTGWYYLNIDGSMAANTTVDGYTLGADGKLI